MRTNTNNSASQYSFILLLSVSFLFAQMFKAHIHSQHDSLPLETTTGHVVYAHVATSLHDTEYNTHQQDDFQDHYYHAEVDVSADSFLKKVELFNIFVLLFFIIGFVLYAPRLRCVSKRYILKIKPISLYYLFQPPLRAPPR